MTTSTFHVQGKKIDIDLTHFEEGEYNKEFWSLSITDGLNQFNVFCNEGQARQIAKKIYDVLEGGE